MSTFVESGPVADPPPVATAPFIDFGRWHADEVLQSLRQNGYVEFADCIPLELLADARRQAHDAVARNGGEYVAIAGQQDLAGPLLNGLHQDPALARLCGELYRSSLDREAKDPKIGQLLRCLKGAGGQAESWYLHFDSYLVTIIVPVDIPATGQSGDLILVKRRRRLRQSYLVNLLQKLVLELKPVQNALWLAIRRGWIATTRLRLKQGSVYLFFGSATLHGNEACHPDALRATLVFHYGNPHQTSVLHRLAH